MGGQQAPTFDDAARMQETEGQLKFLEDAKAEIENFGPNPALVGDMSHSDQSGRAIALLQQAGVAELGPFILAYRGWKVRVYRAIWNAVRAHWKAERWIRVTDDENSVQFVGINQVGTHPQTGMPAMVNQISALDVDIILDEGSDAVNIAADTSQALMNLASAGVALPPGLLIETLPGIDHDVRKKYLDQISQPDPVEQQKQQLEMQHAQAVIGDTSAAAGLKKAQTFKTIKEAQAPPDQGPQENPNLTMAEVAEKMAGVRLKHAQAYKTQVETQLMPHEVAHQQQMDHVSAHQGAHDSEAKMALGRESNAMKGQQSGDKPKKRKKSGNVSISLDGSMADRVSEHTKASTDALTAHAKANSDSMAQIASSMSQSAQALAQSSQQMAASVDIMTKAISAPKRIVRDSKGRASHVETIGQ
jgi:hypothetical protein